MTNPVTIRERILRASNYFYELHGVVLTTFNLDPAFLEGNALPTVFGVETEARATRDAELHKCLGETPCTVFYDPSTKPKFAGGYRYVARPVPIRDNFFHPKLVILAGRGGRNEQVTNPNFDTNWVYLAVSSANLTQSGWGRNAESFGETWIHTSKQQSWHALHDFLEWISSQSPLKIKQNNSDAITQVLNTLREMPDRRRFIDDGNEPWSRTLYANFYSSVVYEDGFAEFIHEKCTKQPSCVWVYSPYWGDIANQVKSFNTSKTNLVPALRQRDGVISITQDQAQELALPQLKIIKNKKEDGKRFWHMKAYWIEKDDYCYCAVGSCNFTKAGLKGKHGNVEAMLVYEADEDSNSFPGGNEVKPDEFAADTTMDDEPPTPAPISIVVVWDWETEMWHWNLADDDNKREFILLLPTYKKGFRIKNGTDSRKGSSPQPGVIFTIYYRNIEGSRKWEKWIGSITESNLDHSTRTYGVPLSANQILDSWRNGLSVDCNRISREIHEIENDGETNNDDTDSPAPFGAVNLFDFYRALRDLKVELANQELSKHRKKAFLVGHSNSVISLANLASQDTNLPAVRYLILFELNKIISEHKKLLGDTQVKNVARMLDRVRKLTIKELKDDPRAQSHPYGIIRWFEKNLNTLDHKEIQ